MRLYAVFVSGIGNIGKGVDRRPIRPRNSIGSYGHTGNYIFDGFASANKIKTQQKSRYVAVCSLRTIDMILRLCRSTKSELESRGLIADFKNEFRLKNGSNTYTMGILFHHSGSVTKMSRNHGREVVLLKNKPHFSIVLKKERMSGIVLNQKHRIPWGVVSKVLGVDGTSRSIRTINGIKKVMQCPTMSRP